MVAALLVAARVSISALSLLPMLPQLSAITPRIKSRKTHSSAHKSTNHSHQTSSAAASLLLMSTTVIASLVTAIIPALLVRRPSILSLALALALAALLPPSQEATGHPSQAA